MYCPSSESSRTVAFFFFFNICYQIWGVGKGKKLKYCLIVLKLFLVLVKTSQKIFFFLGGGEWLLCCCSSFLTNISTEGNDSLIKLTWKHVVEFVLWEESLQKYSRLPFIPFSSSFFTFCTHPSSVLMEKFRLQDLHGYKNWWWNTL